MQIEKVERRYYLRGLPFGLKDTAKFRGCKWDPDQRAWWTGKADVAQDIQTIAETPTAASSPTEGTSEETNDAPKQYVAGKATYNGRTYYIAGSVRKGRTDWDDTVIPVKTRDGAKTLLLFTAGTAKFWAATTAIQVTKYYDKPQTIRGLQRFREEAQRNGGTHRDACPNCGSTRCSTAYGRGGLCDED